MQQSHKSPPNALNPTPKKSTWSSRYQAAPRYNSKGHYQQQQWSWDDHAPHSKVSTLSWSYSPQRYSILLSCYHTWRYKNMKWRLFCWGRGLAEVGAGVAVGFRVGRVALWMARTLSCLLCSLLCLLFIGSWRIPPRRRSFPNADQ